MPRVPKKSLPPLAQSGETFGQRIAPLRNLQGLTQRQLADRIGIVQNLVSDYENDKLRLFDEMVARFAYALRVSSYDTIEDNICKDRFVSRDSKEQEVPASIVSLGRMIP
jgi:transcriptional regulator with XRE-family HTH domain